MHEQKVVKTLNDGLPAIDKKKERQLVRKLDRYIVPVVMLLYLLSFLDRYHSLYTSMATKFRLTTSQESTSAMPDFTAWKRIWA
jgi:hypothetical protein